MTLADFIKWARERRELKHRDLAKNLDHAYIWRLEKGDKDKPSKATIAKLATTLQLNERERQVFSILAEREIDDILYNIMLSRRDIGWPHLEPVATMSFRGQRPSSEEDWLKLIKLIQEL